MGKNKAFILPAYPEIKGLTFSAPVFLGFSVRVFLSIS
jgi:hypothetical protein